MKKIILSILLHVMAGVSHAQIGFAPEIGVNGNTMFIKTNGTVLGTGEKYGVSVGGIMHVAMGTNFFMQTGAFYQQNGCTVDGGGVVNVNAIQVPLYFDYISKHVHEHGLRGYGGIGAYVAYNLNGNVIADGTSTSLKIGNAKSDANGNGGDDLKPMDMGIGINFGSILPFGLYCRMRYQISLVDLCPGADADNAIYNYSACATIGYIFGYKGKIDEAGDNSGRYWYNDRHTRYYHGFHAHGRRNKHSGYSF